MPQRIGRRLDDRTIPLAACRITTLTVAVLPSVALAVVAEEGTTRWTTCLAAWEGVRSVGSAAEVIRTAAAGLAEAGREGTRTGSEASEPVKPRERGTFLSLGNPPGSAIGVGGKGEGGCAEVCVYSPPSLSLSCARSVDLFCKPSFAPHAPNEWTFLSWPGGPVSHRDREREMTRLTVLLSLHKPLMLRHTILDLGVSRRTRSESNQVWSDLSNPRRPPLISALLSR